MLLVLKKGASKKEMDEIRSKLSIIKGVDTKKYCGVIQLKEAPLVMQKKMRDENLNKDF
jgi:hypothetical protein